MGSESRSPEELRRGLRKPTVSDRRLGYKSGAVFFLGLSALAALWLMIDIPRQLIHRQALRRDGRETSAKVLKFGRFGRSSDWWVKYVFVVDGKSIRNEVTVPDSFVKTLAHAKSLPIRYSPTDPENNHPVGWEWTMFSELGWLVGVAWGFPGLLFARELRKSKQAEGARRVDVEHLPRTPLA